MFCKHQWKVIDKAATEPALEVIKRLGYELIKGDLRGTEIYTTTILACEKCGLLDKTTVSNLIGRC